MIFGKFGKFFLIFPMLHAHDHLCLRTAECRTPCNNLQEDINTLSSASHRPSLLSDTRTMRAFYSLIIIFLIFCVTHAKEKEDKGKKEAKKGKRVRYNKKGDIGVTVRWNKWSDPQQRTLCCPLAPKHCKYPCKGLSCRRKTLRNIHISIYLLR